MRIRQIPVAGTLSTEDDTWYAVPGASYATIEGLWVHNASRDDIGVELWINTEAANASYMINVLLTAGHTFYPQVPVFLGPNYEVHGRASDEDAIHLYMSITEYTE